MHGACGIGILLKQATYQHLTWRSLCCPPASTEAAWTYHQRHLRLLGAMGNPLGLPKHSVVTPNFYGESWFDNHYFPYSNGNVGVIPVVLPFSDKTILHTAVLELMKQAVESTWTETMRNVSILLNELFPPCWSALFTTKMVCMLVCSPASPVLLFCSKFPTHHCRFWMACHLLLDIQSQTLWVKSSYIYKII